MAYFVPSGVIFRLISWPNLVQKSIRMNPQKRKPAHLVLRNLGFFSPLYPNSPFKFDGVCSYNSLKVLNLNLKRLEPTFCLVVAFKRPHQLCPSLLKGIRCLDFFFAEKRPACLEKKSTMRFLKWNKQICRWKHLRIPMIQSIKTSFKKSSSFDK